MSTRYASIQPAQGQTCQWLFKNSIYIEWREASYQSGCQFLWIKGKAGAGKSTIMKLALRKATEHFHRSIIASFFYNTQGSTKANTTEGMYRSLLHQIISQLSKLPDGAAKEIDAAQFKKERWPIPILQNLLYEIVSSLEETKSLVFYVDALDECDETDIRNALCHFELLQQQAMSHGITVLICFASRPYPNTALRHQQTIELDQCSEHRDDILQYVQGALHVPDTLGSELCQEIVRRCAGIFLWAMLTVQSMNRLYDQGYRSSQLRVEMDKVPRRLQDIFRDMLQRSDMYTLPMLQWVMFSARPLKVAELYFAVMASTDELPTTYWCDTGEDYAVARKFILSSGKGLLEIPRSGSHVDLPPQLIHVSLREFLLHTGLTHLDPKLDNTIEPSSHASLGEWCQTYLQRHVVDDNADLDHRKISGFEMYERYMNDRNYPFRAYAITQMTRHMSIAFSGGVLPTRTLAALTDLWFAQELWDKSGFCLAKLLCLLLARDIDTIQSQHLGKQELSSVSHMEDEMSSYSESSSSLDRTDWPLLQAAANATPTTAIQLFRRCSERYRGLSFSELVKDFVMTAAAMGLTRVVELLLDYVNIEIQFFYSLALMSAALNLQEDTVMYLVYTRARLDPSAPRDYTRIPLKHMLNAKAPPRYLETASETRYRIIKALQDADATDDWPTTEGLVDHSNRDELMKLFVDLKSTLDHSDASLEVSAGTPKAISDSD